MSDRTVLVVGAGIQGRAAIADLERSAGVDRIVAADIEPAPLEQFLAGIHARKTEPVVLDARDDAALRRLLSSGVDVAIAFVPVRLEPAVAAAAVDAGVNLVTTNYAHDLLPLHDRAAAAGVIIMPEAGFDPGIDLVIAAHAVSQFDRVETLNSYGSGIPALECKDTNALNYKISWSFEGVLASYWRPARVVDNGIERVAPRDEIFSPTWRHDVKVAGAGALEAFVNGDAVTIVERLGIRPAIEHAGRYTLRWPGHCDFWAKIASLGLLDDAPGADGSAPPRDCLRRHLEPRLQYGPAERDMVILRVDVAGISRGTRSARRYELVGYRDFQTGMLAMSRVVGGPASIVAQMILSRQLTRAGVGSPLRDIPPVPFLDELSRRGIDVVERQIDPGECYAMPDGRLR